MDVFIRDIGRKAVKMDELFLNGLMVVYIRVTIKMEKSMV
jgi:hypothetical protein